MKSADEIKKGLAAHADDCCSACTYWDDCHDYNAMREIAVDALAYIQQLEAERDAAVADIGKGCFSCKHGAKELFEEPCNSCRRAGGITDLWQWRGVQKEE